jgi:hypothetical protein
MCGSGAAAAKAPLPASEHSASSAIGLRRPGRAGPRGVQRVGPIHRGAPGRGLEGKSRVEMDQGEQSSDRGAAAENVNGISHGPRARGSGVAPRAAGQERNRLGQLAESRGRLSLSPALSGGLWPAMVLVIILVLVVASAPSTRAPDACVSGNWSVEHQPPAHCTPYPKGLFQVKLPNAGRGGPTDHLAPDSDKIAANSLLMGDLNGTQLPMFREDDHLAQTSGVADSDTNPIYYGRESDPIWKVTACREPGSDPKYNPTNTYWHIPENASYSGRVGGDNFLIVWDQTNNLVFSSYFSSEKFIGTCAAKVEAEACPLPQMATCTFADYSQDLGYTDVAAPGGMHRNGAGDSLDSAPAALLYRL